jgi:acetoin utilization protein AcuB
MSKSIPQISRFMTTSPKSVEKDHSLYEAATLMQKEGIRHLPVVYQGRVEGMLSMTDVNLIMSLKDSDITKLKVYDVFTPNATCVSSDTKLDEVCKLMAGEKIGSVVVEDNEKLVGIFTWIDALNAMEELLHTRLKD